MKNIALTVRLQSEKENCFCACLDVGHCAVTGHDPVKAIYALGDRLEAVHMHDTDYKRDMHTLPLTAQMDHYAIARALKKSGYSGDYTLEADTFLERFAPEFHQDALMFMGVLCLFYIIYVVVEYWPEIVEGFNRGWSGE